MAIGYADTVVSAGPRLAHGFALVCIGRIPPVVGVALGRDDCGSWYIL